MSFDDSDPLHAYTREINSFKPLTKSKEDELFQHVRARDNEAESATRRLIEANLQLVVSIAKRHSSAKIDQLELIQKGNEGLLRALNTFSASFKGSFSDHAAICVESAITEAVAESESKQ
jgi:RNA polymerase primary sigma factor